MSEGTVSFPMATSASRAFVRTAGSGLARSATSDGMRASLLSARATVPRLVVGVMVAPSILRESPAARELATSYRRGQ